jgi:type VI secretion system secreted protein Hcp
MSVEIFLKIEPTVDGESQAKGHEKQIEIFSFSLGASNPSSVATGGGSGAGKVDISSLSIQKQVDLASSKLFLKCCNGTHFDKATLFVREAGGDAPVEYWTMEMKQVFVDSVSWGGAAGGGKPSESVSLSFAEVKITYYSQDEHGAKKDKMEGGWNVKTNAAAA